jgi:hypothetical protein
MAGYNSPRSRIYSEWRAIQNKTALHYLIDVSAQVRCSAANEARDRNTPTNAVQISLKASYDRKIA